MGVCSECGKEFERAFGSAALDKPSLAFTCPDCTRAQIESKEGVKEHAAAELQAALALAAPQRQPIVTYTLIALNVLVFAAMVARGVSWLEPGGAQALRFGANFGPYTLSQQWWRLFTSMFVHFGIVHLALNMWCLWSLGSLAERLMGRAALAVAYVSSGLAGSVASLLWNPMIISAGASGAVFGVAGALLSFIYLKKAVVDPALLKKELSSLGVFIFYNLSHGFQQAGIDNSAHIGGLVMGIPIGALLPRAIVATAAASPSPTAIVQTSRESHAGSRIAFLACAAAVLIVGGAGLARRTQSAAIDLAAGQELLAAGKPALAIDKLKRVVASKPDFALGQYMLGTAYIQADRPADAIAPLKSAVALVPDDADFQHNLAAAYLATEDYDQAIAWFQKVMPKESNDVRTHFGLGAAYFGKQLFDKAIAEEKAAMKLDPNFTSASRILAAAYLQKGQFDDAIATYESLLAKHPDDTETAATLNLAKALKSVKTH